MYWIIEEIENVIYRDGACNWFRWWKVRFNLIISPLPAKSGGLMAICPVTANYYGLAQNQWYDGRH